MKRWLSFAVMIVSLAGCAGCKVDTKTEEKRLLAEINRVAEESRNYINSDEVRSRLIRLNELRQSFPARREETAKAAEAVKEAFGRMIEDDRRLAALYKSLLKLPLSESYAKCMETQLQTQELTTIQSQRVIDEMGLFSDSSINDLQQLSERTQSLRGNGDLEKKAAELEAYLDQNCRRPPSDSKAK